MPQMAPLNWLTLFMSFNIILIICLTKIWFTAPTNTQNNILENKMILSKNKNFNMLWKW